MEQVAAGDLREADASQEILKPSVGSERIEGRPQEDGGVEARLIGLVQPDHRLVLIAEPYIDQGNIGVGRRVLICRASRSFTILIASSCRPDTA